MTFRWLFLPLVLAIATACPGGGTGPDGGQPDGSTGDPDASVGGFAVKLVSPESTSTDAGYTTVVGKVYDGPTPQLIVWEKAAEAAPCVLLTPRVPFCSTPCGGSAACVENDTCQRYPTSKSAGDVAVSGIRTSGGATGFTMTPVVNTYQPPSGTTPLPFPAFSEGDAIRFDAAGGAFAPFSLQAPGIAPLVLANASVPLQSGQAVTLGWTPAQSPGASRLKVKLDISHHAGSKGKIECDAPDTGSLTISADLVTQLLGLGVAGFPTIIVTRQATGSAVISAGRVDLAVSSELERPVTIAGLTSCNDNADCPPPKTCQPDLTCQ